jgi:hypothetical protein
MSWRINSRRWVALGAASIIVCCTQAFSQDRFSDFPSFKMTRGTVDSDGLPTSEAKLCLLKPADICFQMPSKKINPSDSVVYEFGLNARSERLALPGGGSFIFFSSQFSEEEAARWIGLLFCDTKQMARS